MDVFMSGLAVFVLTLLVIGLSVYKAAFRSFTTAQIFMTTGKRQSEIIVGKLIDISSDRAFSYKASCEIEENGRKQVLELKVPDDAVTRLCKSGRKQPIQLERTRIKGGEYYRIIGQTEQNHSHKNGDNVVVLYDENDASAFDKKARMLHAIGYVLSAISLPMTSSSLFTAVFMNCAAAAIFFFVIPFKKPGHKEAQGFMTTEEKKQVEKRKSKDDHIPAGYNDWSETERELYDIEARIGAEVIMPGEEFSELAPEEEPDNLQKWEYADVIYDDFNPTDEDKAQPGPKKENDSDSKKSQDTKQDKKVESSKNGYKICKSCGSLVDGASTFCSECGAKLDGKGGSTFNRRNDNKGKQGGRGRVPPPKRDKNNKSSGNSPKNGK